MLSKLILAPEKLLPEGFSLRTLKYKRGISGALAYRSKLSPFRLLLTPCLAPPPHSQASRASPGTQIKEKISLQGSSHKLSVVNNFTFTWLNIYINKPGVSFSLCGGEVGGISPLSSLWTLEIFLHSPNFILYVFLKHIRQAINYKQRSHHIFIFIPIFCINIYF